MGGRGQGTGEQPPFFFGVGDFKFFFFFFLGGGEGF